MAWTLWLVIGFGALFTMLLPVALLVMGIATLRAAGRIVDTPTSKVRSVAIGFAELKGTADREVGQALTAPFSKRPCVYYEVSIDRYERTGSGDHERTSWVRKWTHHDFVPFSLDDSTGSIPITVKRSTISIAPDREWRARKLSAKALETLRSPDPSIEEHPSITRVDGTRITERTGDYRLRERIIDFEKTLYVLGTVKRDSSGVHVDLDRFQGPFIVSDQPEHRLVTTMRIAGWVLVALSLMILVPVLFVGFGVIVSFLA